MNANTMNSIPISIEPVASAQQVTSRDRQSSDSKISPKKETDTQNKKKDLETNQYISVIRNFFILNHLFASLESL